MTIWWDELVYVTLGTEPAPEDLQPVPLRDKARPRRGESSKGIGGSRMGTLVSRNNGQVDSKGGPFLCHTHPAMATGSDIAREDGETNEAPIPPGLITREPRPRDHDRR
jgi:hypothetical protein